MYNLAVVEEFDEKIMAVITEKLKNRRIEPGIILTRVESLEALGKLSLDILVLSSKAAKKTETQSTTVLQCKFFLVPGADSAKTTGRVRADRVVSYGMSARDSITLSSINEKDCVISLQRELITINGHISEQQEIPIQPVCKASPDNLMAATGVLLLLGVLE